MSNKRKRMGLVAVLLCAALFMSACGKIKFASSISKKDLLKCEKETMSLAESRLYLMTLTNEYKTLYGFDIWEKLEASGDVDASGDASGAATLKEYVRDRTMERVQNVFCMYLLAQNQEITLTETETALAEKAAEVYFSSLSEDEIKYLDVDQDLVTTAYERYTLANKVYAEMTGDEVSEISDDTARVMTAQMICVDDEEQADAVETELARDYEFDVVASEYSTLNSIDQNILRGAFPEAVVNAAFDLDVDEVSGRIEADGKYYFVKCIATYDPELTEENRQVIEQQLREELFDENYDSFIRTIDLKVNEEKWAEEEVNLDSNLTNSSFFAVYNQYFENN